MRMILKISKVKWNKFKAKFLKSLIYRYQSRQKKIDPHKGIFNQKLNSLFHNK